MVYEDEKTHFESIMIFARIQTDMLHEKPLERTNALGRLFLLLNVLLQCLMETFRDVSHLRRYA